MKNLFLIRHAKSSWSSPELSDIERPLNKRGKHDAPLMGNLLKEKSIFPDIILSSPAKRALSTAKVIAEKINYPVENIKIKNTIYEASVPALINILETLGNNTTNVMIFGHNPGFTSLANYLCNSFNYHIPTCGIVHLQFDIDNWNEITGNSATLISFEYPKKYK